MADALDLAGYETRFLGARALGADEFWIKPVDQGRLLRKLGSLVTNGTRGKVLVVDDDERARYLMRKHLASAWRPIPK